MSSRIGIARYLFSIFVATSVSYGCATNAAVFNGSGVQPPPPTLPPPRLYVGNFTGGISAFNLPIASTSTPVATIATVGTYAGGNINFDTTGRLYVAQGSVAVYSQPIRTGSTPHFRFKTSPSCGSPWPNPPCLAFEVSLDSAGDAFVLENGDCHPFPCGELEEFKAPITSASKESVAFPVSGYLVNIAVDAVGNLWLTNSNGLSDSTICEFVPPFTGSPAFCLDVGGPVNLNGLAFDSAGSLYVASESGIWVFNPPFSGSTTPAFEIGSGNHVGDRSVAFDSNGNLYTNSNYGNSLIVYAPPFSASSTPSVTLSLSALGINGGPIAIGP